MGFSRASARALCSRIRSTAESAAGGSAAGAGVSGEGGESGEEEEEGEDGLVRREVSSRNWASSESLKMVGRERFCFTSLRKARMSCLRFAGRAVGGLERRVLARATRVLSVSLGSEVGRSGVEASSGAEGEVSAGSTEGSASVGRGLDFFKAARNLRLLRRSRASLGAPVA